MKKISILATVILGTTFVISSCSKKADVQSGNGNELTPNEITMIKDAGLNPTGAIRTDDGYLIEGDIALTSAELNELNGNNGPEVIVGNTEQYRTTNLVTGLPRVIRVKYVGSKSSVSTALTNAVARYNAQSLLLTFQKVTSGSANITISDVSGVSYIASGGFPSGGNPYSSILFNTAYSTWSSTTLTSVIAHEIGHCIGMRHTDYMNRSYSCGGAFYNEGSAGVGAIWIPGTPTGPDPNSWMLACIGNGVNRPFNANDIKALKYVY